MSRRLRDLQKSIVILSNGAIWTPFEEYTNPPKKNIDLTPHFFDFAIFANFLFSARARVGAQSGLGPGPGWGPYGPLCFLLKMLRFGFRRLRLTK